MSAARFALLLLLVVAAPAFAAAPDGVIDVSHVSHVPWQDRRPLCPVDQQAFTVQLRALHSDLTAVRVFVINTASFWVDAAKVRTRGAYDQWEATVPAGSGAVLGYWFELQDGAARAYVSAPGAGAAMPADSGFTVNFTTLSHAPYGATPLPGGGVVFKVWAPSAPAANVRGEFNGWGVTAMQRVGSDFVVRVPTATVNQQYKYFFPVTSTWSIDARGRVLDPAAFLWNSRIADPTTFAWTDSAWRAPPLEQMAVYQLNVGTFCGLNDPHGTTPFPSRFVDVAARAHELAKLGVNAVMLNPVTSTPILTYAGYSTLTPWSPQFEYGSPDDFKTLVDAFHREGIAVLCDIVWNHFDGDYRLLWNYDGSQLFYETPNANTPWGPQAAFGRAGVDDWYVHSALHWLEEYHVDGFRMDAAAYMANPPHTTQGWALMQRFNEEVERRYTDAVRIAEYFPVRANVVLSPALGGAGFDATYNGDYRSNLRYSVPQPSGFSWPGNVEVLRTPIGGLSSGRQSFNYFELHDDAWTPAHRFVKDVAPTPGVIADSASARMRVAMGLLMLTPGVPAFLMGNEWLETADFGTAQANRIDWSRRTTNAAYYGFVQELLGLRTHVAAFRADAPSLPTHTNYNDGVMAWLRHDELGRLYLVISNAGDTDFPSYVIGAPLAGGWVERLNSQAAAWGGTGAVNAGTLGAFPQQQDGYPNALVIRLPRSSVIVLQSLNTVEVASLDAARPLRIDAAWPNPARGEVRVRWSLPRGGDAEVAVFDVQGRRVATLARGTQAAGSHDATWSGRDEQGRPAAPGVYLVRVRTNEGLASRRVVRVE